MDEGVGGTAEKMIDGEKDSFGIGLNDNSGVSARKLDGAADESIEAVKLVEEGG